MVNVLKEVRKQPKDCVLCAKSCGLMVEMDYDRVFVCPLGDLPLSCAEAREL